MDTAETVQKVDVAEACSKSYILAINDTLNVLHGKWKLPVLGCIIQGKKRFTEFERSIPGITPRMLSKELKDLEANGVIVRAVNKDAAVEYTLTLSGNAFLKVLNSMVEWGLNHREMTMSGVESNNVTG